jgi:hypothetical protein
LFYGSFADLLLFFFRYYCTLTADRAFRIAEPLMHPDIIISHLGIAVKGPFSVLADNDSSVMKVKINNMLAK